MLSGCAYAWLSVATTRDPQLLADASSAKLPIIASEISIRQFLWIAPVILIGLYLYFHLAYTALWETLADLPAVFGWGATGQEGASVALERPRTCSFCPASE